MKLKSNLPIKVHKVHILIVCIKFSISKHFLTCNKVQHIKTFFDVYHVPGIFDYERGSNMKMEETA
jgi:hypothetical protein